MNFLNLSKIENYRSISNLNIILKILDKVVANNYLNIKNYVLAFSEHILFYYPINSYDNVIQLCINYTNNTQHTHLTF